LYLLRLTVVSGLLKDNCLSDLDLIGLLIKSYFGAGTLALLSSLLVAHIAAFVPNFRYLSYNIVPQAHGSKPLSLQQPVSIPHSARDLQPLVLDDFGAVKPLQRMHAHYDQWSPTFHTNVCNPYKPLVGFKGGVWATEDWAGKPKEEITEGKVGKGKRKKREERG